MPFRNDVFISYAHKDSQPPTAGAQGWVSEFHEALCRHVSRPLAEIEWRRFAPEGACFTARAAQPCER